MSEPQPQLEIPTRAPAATSADDTILPFQVEALDLRGRVVRFGPAIDIILSRHNYPVPVAKLLGEAIVLTVLLGSTLKFEGRFILQTQSDGPVRMLVIDYTTPGKVRACARFDAARVAAAIASGVADPGALLGHGHLAMTIDQGPDTARYQGIVALEGKDLEPGDVPEGMEFQPQPEDDAWVQGRSLVATVEDLELLDPDVSAEQLLYRLFHEPGVRVFRSRDLHAQCSCSRAGVERMLRSFPQDDRDHMVENGKITVTCEFCNSTYVFAPMDVREPEPSQPEDAG